MPKSRIWGDRFIKSRSTSVAGMAMDFKHIYLRRSFQLALIILTILIILLILNASNAAQSKVNHATQYPVLGQSTGLNQEQDKSNSFPSTSSDINSSSSSASGGGVSSNNSLTVNGKNIPVPKNGHLQTTVTSPDGSTTNVNVSSSTSGNAQNFSSSNTTVNSSSSSSSSTDISINQSSH